MPGLPKKTSSTVLPEPTIVDVLMDDHLNAVLLCRKFEGATDPLLKETLADAIEISVRLHSQGEMDVLYPFVEKTLGAKDMVRTCLEEHSTVEAQALEALQQRKEGGDKLGAAIKSITSEFTEHLLKEENDIMMKVLESGATESDLLDLAQQFTAAKEKAPLDPQPVAA